jgi:hypothetical protein
MVAVWGHSMTTEHLLMVTGKYCRSFYHVQSRQKPISSFYQSPWHHSCVGLHVQ